MLSSGIKKFAIAGIVIGVLFISVRDNFHKFIVKGNVKNRVQVASSGEFVSLKAGQELITNRTVKTVAQQKAAAEQRGLLLGGIFFVPNNKSYVIINGQVVAEGSISNGILVKNVRRNKAEFIKDGKSIILKANQMISFIK